MNYNKNLRAIVVLASVLSWCSYLHGEERVISLDERTVVQKSLEESFRVKIEAINTEISKEGVSEARGVYDPVLEASTYQLKDYDADDDRSNISSVGVSGILPTATSYEIKATESSEHSDTTVDRSARELSLELSQPLLNNSFGRITRHEIRIAKLDHEMSEQEFADEVVLTVSDALTAFYNAYAALEYYSITERNEATTRELLDANKERVELGVISPSDILQAESELLRRQVEKEDARRIYHQYLNQIRSLVSSEVDTVLDFEIELAELNWPSYEKKNRQNALMYAFDKRPDLKKAVLALSKSEAETVIAKNNALPDVDLVAGMTWANEDEYENYSDFNERQGYLGLEFSWPVPNRSKFAERRKAKAQQRRSELGLKELKQSVYLEIDNSIRNIETQWKRLEKAKKARELAEASLKAEEEKFHAGNSSTFIILRLQGDLADAEVSEVFIKSSYRKALLEYDTVTGLSLEKYNIVGL